ncbi:MAG: Gfo/Idh/MocA family oxidoreductase [Smithellaceae bacterium]
MTTTTSPNNVEPRTLNLEHSTSSVEPRTLNLEHSTSSVEPRTLNIEPSIAVIGAGYWGKNLVRNFHQLGVLKTICDGAQPIREEMAKTYPTYSLTLDGRGKKPDMPASQRESASSLPLDGGGQGGGEGMITPNLSDVLEDPAITGVVIAAPAALHYEIAEKALNAGKHVFVEKPLSLNQTDGEKLVRLAEQKQKTLFVGHILHYHAAVIRLKEMIKTGKIGRLQYIYSRRLSFGKIRREENILWSFAPHDISIILSLTGEEPSYVDSVGSNFLHARIADVTMTNLKFPSGIGAHIFVSWLNPYKEQKLVIVGSSGMLVFDDTEPIEKKLVHYPHTINWQNGLPVPNKAESVAIDLKDIWEEPLKAECKAFLSAIKTNTKPLTSGEEGLKVLKVLELSQHSLEQKEQNSFNLEHRTLNVEQSSPVEPRTLNVEPSPSNIEPETLNIEPRTRFFAHETAIIDDNVEIGEKTKIWHFSHILSGSKIGENCNIGQNVVIGPDATIGNKCKIQNNVSVYKGVTLEDGVFCGPSMVFTNIFNPRAEIGKMDQVRPTLIKKGATLGANCTIVCGHTIGRYAFIGAGAVVTKDVPDHALMVGNPARQIGWMCECGEKLNTKQKCPACKKQYKPMGDTLK